MAGREMGTGEGRVSRRIGHGLGLLTLLALCATTAWAGSNDRLGTGGATELLIPVGPRGTALGPSVASDITGIESIYWNPAGLGGMERTEVLFSHTAYFADMSVNYAAVATRVGGFGTLGFSAKALSIGDVIVTTEQAPEGTGEILDPTFAVLGVSWGRQFTDRVTFGLNANYVTEKVQSVGATGFGFDFGVQYNTGWKSLALAMTVKNIGSSMKFDGDNLDISVQPPGSEPSASNRVVRFTTAEFEMPSYFTLAANYDLYRQSHSFVQFRAAFQSNNFSGDNFSGGLEWSYKDMLALRGSWFGTLNEVSDPATGNTTSDFKSGDDLYQGFALGGGFNVKAGDVRMDADVAWRPVTQFFSDIVEVGVRFRF